MAMTTARILANKRHVIMLKYVSVGASLMAWGVMAHIKPATHPAHFEPEILSTRTARRGTWREEKTVFQKKTPSSIGVLKDVRIFIKMM